MKLNGLLYIYDIHIKKNKVYTVKYILLVNISRQKVIIFTKVLI